MGSEMCIRDRFMFDAQNGDRTVTDFDLNKDVLVFFDEIEGEGADQLTLVPFLDAGIDLINVESVIENYATVTDDGVLFDFEQGSTILLNGVDTLVGLENVISFFSGEPDIV